MQSSNMNSRFSSPECKDSFFFSLEGIEGSGKSSQINLLKIFLNSRGYRVVMVREPGGTSFGEKLREAILQSPAPLDPIAEAYLFASARAQLLTETILKELKIPKTVIICDRYIDSSIAYQGVGRGLGVDTILDIHSYSPLNIFPHLTFYIKISLKTSFGRQRARNNDPDYFESENIDFYKLLIRGYNEAVNRFPERIKVIDGEENLDQVFHQIQKEVEGIIL